MVTVALSTAMQVFVVAVTVGMLIFFLYENYKGRAKWEILFVSFVEAFVYVLATILYGTDDWPVFGPNNAPMIRYLSWMVTCPFLIKVMLSMVNSTMDVSKINKLIAADIVMNGTGIMCCLYRNDQMGIKMAVFALGCLVGMYIVHCVWQEWLLHKDELDQLNFRRFLMGIMFFSWTSFPVLFLLGPETFNLIEGATSINLHSLADLIAKNFFSFVAWKIQRNHDQAIVDREEKEQQDLIKLDIISNAASGAFDTASLDGNQNLPDGFAQQGSRNGSRRTSPRSTSRKLGGYEPAAEPLSARLQDSIRKTKDTIRSQEDEIAQLKRQLSGYNP